MYRFATCFPNISCFAVGLVHCAWSTGNKICPSPKTIKHEEHGMFAVRRPNCKHVNFRNLDEWGRFIVVSGFEAFYSVQTCIQVIKKTSSKDIKLMSFVVLGRPTNMDDDSIVLYSGSGPDVRCLMCHERPSRMVAATKCWFCHVTHHLRFGEQSWKAQAGVCVC